MELFNLIASNQSIEIQIKALYKPFTSVIVGLLAQCNLKFPFIFHVNAVLNFRKLSFVIYRIPFLFNGHVKRYEQIRLLKEIKYWLLHGSPKLESLFYFFTLTKIVQRTNQLLNTYYSQYTVRRIKCTEHEIAYFHCTNH